MGAADFQTYGFGKTADEAYRGAVSEALYWSGHGGYTGTIAEKGGYELITLPPRVSGKRFLKWLYDLSWADHSEYSKERLHYLETHRAPPGKGEAWRKEKAQLRKQIKDAQRVLAKLPKQHLPLLQRAEQIFDDKWGPALAFEVNGTEAREAKDRHGLKGSRKKVFCFCGYAST
jgi:hypothetical protein